MMKNIISILLSAVTLMIIIAGCSGMNDKLDVYLDAGERIYIGKIDSLKPLVGANRVKLIFWASDPRAKSVSFYWYPNNDSMVVQIAPSVTNTYFEAYIGGPAATNTIEEGSYTLRAITRDGASHYSIPFEKVVNIYGDKFRATLTNRVLKTVAYAPTTSVLSLTYSGPVNEKEIGIVINYTDKAGIDKKMALAEIAIPTTPLAIPNVDKTKPVSYKTMFLPEPLAIDTFYTDSKNIAIP